MNARFVRGVDPMDSMELGRFHERQLDQAKAQLKSIFDRIVKEYEGRSRVYKALSSLETGVKATWTPESSKYGYGMQMK